MAIPSRIIKTLDGYTAYLMDKRSVVTPPKKAESKKTISLSVDPGICGFPCTIKARQIDRHAVSIEIFDSECKQIQHLSEQLSEDISLKELFLPLTQSPVYIVAEKVGCHTSCALPAAILKAVEAAMDMALPKSVNISFLPPGNERD